MANTTTTVVIAERTTTLFDNAASKAGKTSINNYFGDYETQLRVQWDGLKSEDTAFKALNSVIAGIAGGQGEKPYIWLVKNFSRFVTEDLRPCNRYKDEEGRECFRLAALSGVTARGLLKKAAINCIESNRIGNRFKQTIVVPTVKK